MEDAAKRARLEFLLFGREGGQLDPLFRTIAKKGGTIKQWQDEPQTRAYWGLIGKATSGLWELTKWSFKNIPATTFDLLTLGSLSRADRAENEERRKEAAAQARAAAEMARREKVMDWSLGMKPGLMTPGEQLREKMQLLKEADRGGFLTRTEQARAVNVFAEEYAKAIGAGRDLAPAAAWGSQEAYGLWAEALSSGRDQQAILEDILRVLQDLNNRGNRLGLGGLLDLLSPASRPLTVDEIIRARGFQQSPLDVM
jgi:hypothetical protein